MKNVSFFKNNRYVIGAFLVSLFIIIITYIVRGIFPFGNNTILRVDLFHQYAPYLEELRSRIINGQSLLYSWEGGLGKDFIAQMAYYTASPLNILIFLFPQQYLSEAVALLIALKISLSSSFFSFYLKSHFQKNELSILAFGLLYGFCAFVTCYYWNIMWLDSVALFPLLALGVEKLIHSGHHVLYYVILTLTMIVNFYLAVLICIFTALYFTVVIFSNYSCHKNRSFICHKTLSFAFLSILAAISACFILLPVSHALGQTAVSKTVFPDFSFYTNIFQLPVNHFLGSRAAVLARNEDLPNIYSGVITLLLLPLYYSCKKINRREKWLLSILLCFMLLCACIKPLDFIIHGFHFPSNLPHRYTFIYSFFLIYMAYQAFIHIKDCCLKPLLIFSGIYLVVILFSEYILVKLVPDIDRVLSNADILINILLMAVYIFFLYGLSICVSKKSLALKISILLFVIVECLFSFICNLDETGDRNAYIKYMTDTSETLSYLDENENDPFYRTEFRRFTTINDAALYHYNGFSQFSSLAPGGISSFIEHLGIAATSNSFRYYDPTPLVDAIFNIKYVMNKDEPHPKADKYKFIKQFGSVWLYQNLRTLPLGFMTDPDILFWETAGSQPFSVQNDFIHKAANVQQDMFTMLQPDTITQTYMDITNLSDMGCFNYTLTDPGDLSLLPTVSAEYTAPEDQYLYFYVDAANAQRFRYRNNSVNEDRELSAGRSLIDVGHVSAGEKIYVEFTLTKKGQFEKTYRKEGTVKLYAASYNDDVFQEAYDMLCASCYKISEHTDTYVTGTVSALNDGILFTSIPFIDGWTAAIDGQPADIIPIAEAGVIGVKISAGDHEVTFTYDHKNITTAVIISVIGILLFCFYVVARKHYPFVRRVFQ